MTCASGSDSARLAPYRSARQPAATTSAPEDAAPSSWSMDSSLAAWMNPQVLTRTTSAPSVSPGPVTVQPAASSRAASSSESTSLRAQPREIRLTVRPARPAVGSRDGTPADYGKPASAAPADAPTTTPAVATPPTAAQVAPDAPRLPGRKLSVTGWLVPAGGPAGEPFTTSVTPPGLPSFMWTRWCTTQCRWAP